MKSKALANLLNRWYKNLRHEFEPANEGIVAAKCRKCGLLVTVQGRVQDEYGLWLQNFKPKRVKRLWYDPSQPRWSFLNEREIHQMIEIPLCGLGNVKNIMES